VPQPIDGLPSRIDVAEVLSLREFEERAVKCMPVMSYEYVASGAGDEHTMHWNRQAYDRVRLRPRILHEASPADTGISLFGHSMPFPILLAPTAYQKMIHPEGELETARGAGAAQATWVVSSASNVAIEDISRAATAPLWFQLYVQSDRNFTSDLVRRAEDAGCEALCVTVDTPVLGPRNRQARAGFKLPPGVATPHFHDIGAGGQEIMNPRRTAVTWKDLEWLRSLVRVPLVLKGILSADDAERAIEIGAHGIIVSNHGGRNLDTTPATLDALPEVVDMVAGRVPILIDGGIQRGTDVLKAIAIGATAVLIGRPYCFALAVAGAEGVRRSVEILRNELEMALMLVGRPRLKDVDRSVIW